VSEPPMRWVASQSAGGTFVLDRSRGRTYPAVTRYPPSLNDMTKARDETVFRSGNNEVLFLLMRGFNEEPDVHSVNVY
jgi:hypothetical protein